MTTYKCGRCGNVGPFPVDPAEDPQYPVHGFVEIYPYNYRGHPGGVFCFDCWNDYEFPKRAEWVGLARPVRS